MFQVEGWVSGHLNVNLLIKQIHLDYLGLRDIKQVPSLQSPSSAACQNLGWQTPRAVDPGMLCFVLWSVSGFGWPWTQTTALAQHNRDVLTGEVSALFRVLLQGPKGSTFCCAWWVAAWCWGEGLGGQGWLQLLLLHRCVRHGQQPLHSLHLLLRWFNKTLNERWWQPYSNIWAAAEGAWAQHWAL